MGRLIKEALYHSEDFNEHLYRDMNSEDVSSSGINLYAEETLADKIRQTDPYGINARMLHLEVMRKS